MFKVRVILDAFIKKHILNTGNFKLKNSAVYGALIVLLSIACASEVICAEPGKKDFESPPPRIIRACCAFGADLQLVGIPFAKINQVLIPDELGNHHFLGDSKEGNGIIYTSKGGFVDIAHLRDQADWTRYLYTYILENRNGNMVIEKLGYEGGVKKLEITVPSELDSSDCLLLAGTIAYDLSLWHELSTWFGASSVPMMPERYSSFSVEDAYSNLLGVKIGMEALKSDLPYNEAMTQILYSTLSELGAAKTEEDTYAALDAVRNIWWTNEKRLPSSKVLMEHNTDVYTLVHPLILPGPFFASTIPEILYVPKTSSDKQLLTNYYKLEIDLNYKFPVKELFPDRKSRLITQNDFELMLQFVDRSINEVNVSQKHVEISQSTTGIHPL